METERDIFRLFAEGNAEAFRKIFESFYPKVYGFVEHLVHDPDEAKDVTQKIFIRMWINRDKFLDVNGYDSYIFILSKYTVLNHIRHRKTPVTDAPLHDIRDSGSPEDKVQMQEIRKRVDGIVEKMPRQRRQIFRMSRMLGLRNDEIARELDLSKKTVENHINLALKEIRKKFPVLFLLIFIGAQEILIVFKI